MPAVDPRKWAEERKAKIEHAEKLRAERRVAAAAKAEALQLVPDRGANGYAGVPDATSAVANAPPQPPHQTEVTLFPPSQPNQAQPPVQGAAEVDVEVTLFPPEVAPPPKPPIAPVALAGEDNRPAAEGVSEITAVFEQACANREGDTQHVGAAPETDKNLCDGDATYFPTQKRVAARKRREEEQHGQSGYVETSRRPQHRRSASEPRPDVSSTADAEPDAARWAAGLRGSVEDDPVSDDPLVFGKPRSPPVRPPRKSPLGRRPPRPCSGDGVELPKSPHVQQADPTVAQQMPEALKRRLEQRSWECRAEQRAAGNREVDNDATSMLPPVDVPARVRARARSWSQPPEPSISNQLPEALRRRLDQRFADRKADVSRSPMPGGQRSPSQQRPRAVSESVPDEHELHLPPIDAVEGPRGLRLLRRSSSQAKAEEAGPRHSDAPAVRRPSRPHSVGGEIRVKNAAPGKDDDEKGGRQMFDKNTLRARHKAVFVPAIVARAGAMKAAAFENAGAPNADGEAVVRVCVRKRPIFDKEAQAGGDYDVLTVLPDANSCKHIVLHNCLFQADLKTPFISHCTFGFDHVFGEDAENLDVYADCGEPLVQAALNGGFSTMFMFGQTGSGKTHTMSAIEEFAAHDLFAPLQGGDDATVEPWLSIQFVELRGDRCFDLLDPPGVPAAAPGKKKGAQPPRPELKIRESKGLYTVDGAQTLLPESPEQLCDLIRGAHARRATSATDANAVSSRSHAVCTLRLLHSNGQLLLIDCAGTERRKDSMYHSKERQQEGAEINASLHALKECIRHLTSRGHQVPPYTVRASSLTKILAHTFARGQDARLAVICTASPCASDTEHTLATLRTGTSLCSKGCEKEERQLLLDFVEANKKPRVQHPKTWTAEQVREWIAEVEGGRFQDVLDALPSNFTGQMLVRVTETRCVQLCGGNQRRGRALFDLLHEEMRRADK